MHARTTRTARATRVLFAVLALALTALVGSAPMAAAATKEATPSPSCYFDNGDGTVTVTIAVTNTSGSAKTLPIGSQNKINPGAQDRGQPTSFAPGTTDNAWDFTVTPAELSTLRWNLDGNTVSLATTTACSSTAVPADGNPLATLVVGALASLVGAALIGERRRKLRAAA